VCGLSLYYQTLSFFEVSIELTGNTVLYLPVISYIMSNTNSKYSDVNIYITIKVKDGTGDDTMFTIKKITKMKKVFDVYAQVKESKRVHFVSCWMGSVSVIMIHLSY